MGDLVMIPVRDSAARIAPLIGPRVRILHGPTPDGDPDLTGTDIDCAVSGIDLSWPLRLDGGWRLCQCLHYDFKAWYWVLERDGEILCFDTTDDPLGLGRDSVPTDLFTGDPPVASSDGIEAAYLTTKRVRKGINTEAEWARIGRLAGDDDQGYRRALAAMMGTEAAQFVVASGLSGRPLAEDVRRRARLALFRRRYRTPDRLAMALLMGARRELERVTHPTGVTVVVVGPDGSGKSTLADALPDLCEGMFRRHLRIHWRPGVLPRPGAMIGGPEADHTQPHIRPSHGRVTSTLLLAYHWLDFLVGGWTRLAPARARSGLVVVERGWWDIAVDPRRYRLQTPPGLVRALGGLLPRPDLVLVLEAPPDVLAGRKSEIPRAELAGQTERWRTVLPPGVRRAYLDATRPQEWLRLAAREEILRFMERRAVARLGDGWVRIPGRSLGGWAPRGPGKAARTGLLIFRPNRLRGRLAWEGARVVAGLGGLRAVPRGDAPPKEVRDILAPHVPPGGSMAVRRSNHPGRFVAVLASARGEAMAVAKVAVQPGASLLLDREARAITDLATRLQPPLCLPTVIASEPGMLLLKAIPWERHARQWRLEDEVALGLGAFFRAGAHEREGVLAGPAHGDCAPWNVLRSGDTWTLVDWEHALEDAPPLYDVCHHLVQCHLLLGRPTLDDLFDGFRGAGNWVGGVVRAYMTGAHMPMTEAEPFLKDYLRMSQIVLGMEEPPALIGIRERARLLARLEGGP